MQPIQKKQQILQLITENPFLTQLELAERLTISRSAVASHISALTQEGAILGRAYILPKRTGILCIGGANTDRKIQTAGAVQWATSNPSSVTESHGGVARNIAENLGRIGASVSLLTMVGHDIAGDTLLKHCQSLGVDTTLSFRSEAFKTGSYTAILNELGDLLVALADMEIYDAMDRDRLQTRAHGVLQFEMAVMDTNLPAESLQYLIEFAKHHSFPLCAVPVSSPKATRLPFALTGLALLITNIDEAEALTQLSISSLTDAEQACRLLQSRGCPQVIVTRGHEGIACLNADGNFTSFSAEEAHVVDVTGAGDAFVAGVLYALQENFSLEAAGRFGMKLSKITLSTKETVSSEINPTYIQTLKESMK